MGAEQLRLRCPIVLLLPQSALSTHNPPTETQRRPPHLSHRLRQVVRRHGVLREPHVARGEAGDGGAPQVHDHLEQLVQPVVGLEGGTDWWVDGWVDGWGRVRERGWGVHTTQV